MPPSASEMPPSASEMPPSASECIRVPLSGVPLIASECL